MLSIFGEKLKCVVRDYGRIGWRYANDVLRGKIVAGKWLKLAAQRAVDDRAASKGRKDPFHWDRDEAARACAFIEMMPHVEGVWNSATIHLEPWQIFLIGQVFGWRHRDTDLRRYTDVYVEVARKNGKSALTSGIALYCFVYEGEIGPQVRCAATSGDQARIVFDVCRKMIQARPDLKTFAGLSVMQHVIHCAANQGTIKPINAKASTQDGLNPHLTVIDELHAHQNRALFDVLKSARGARRNPLSWYITTAGYTHGVCLQQRDMVCKILERAITGEHYFGLIYTIDDDDNPFDEECWIKANPNLGVSKHWHIMRSNALDAANSPAEETEFRTKDLNQWLSAASRWLNLAQWDACTDSEVTLDDMEGRDCWIGGDLGESDDLCAVAFVFPEDDGKWRIFCRHYHPREVVEENQDRTGAPYGQWAKEGWLTLTDGAITDLDHIEKDLRETYMPMFNVRALTFDKQGSRDLVTRLYNDGYLAGQLQKSAAQISDTAKAFEARVKHGLLVHEQNPVLRWNVANCCIRRNVAETILPQKENPDSPNKVDGIDAILNAAKRMGDDMAEGKSYWESMPVMVV